MLEKGAPAHRPQSSPVNGTEYSLDTSLFYWCWWDNKSVFGIQSPSRAVSVRFQQGQVRSVNTLRPRQGGRHFPDDIFKCIFLNENIQISIKISLKFVPKGQINNIPALVRIMAWRRPGDKPLSEPMMVSLLTHICVTRPQWVNSFQGKDGNCAEITTFSSCINW